MKGRKRKAEKKIFEKKKEELVCEQEKTRFEQALTSPKI